MAEPLDWWRGFLWHGQRLSYWDADYNNTRNNERAVELSIVDHWLETSDTPPGVGLEVGNVLGHYDAPWVRRVVDLFEEAEGVENIDVMDITGSYPWIVAVSTLEHVGLDDGTGRSMGAFDALVHLRSLLVPGGRMLVTVPLGHNQALDRALELDVFDPTRQCTLHRHEAQDRPPTWTQAPEPFAPRPYDSVAASAAAVWIGEWARG